MFSMERKDIPDHLLKYFEPKRAYKPKDDLMIPHRVYDRLMVDGWYGRSDIVWSKTSPMPESVKDRPTKAHEYIFLLSKSPQYYYDYEAIQEVANYDGRKDTFHKGSEKYESLNIPGQNGQTVHARGHERWPTERDGVKYRNKRSVWTVNTKPYPEAHFAVYPPELIESCIKAGSPEGGVALDPFMGSGTTAWTAKQLARHSVGIELNPDYCELIVQRCSQQTLF